MIVNFLPKRIGKSKEGEMEAIADTRNDLKLEFSGSDLREMFGLATIWLEDRV